MNISFRNASLILRRTLPTVLLIIGAFLSALGSLPGRARAQTKAVPARSQGTAKHSNSPDLKHQPTLYLVGYAHLDTQWRWEYPQVISEYLPDTMHKNFALFQKYPHYIFNWTGANRYLMMKEYYPADFAKLKHYVATGQWFPAGSSMEENDVNSPSPESIIRQVLYGNEYFRHEFGKASEEYMLPDCFGFPADLPSILAAAGIKGFSTQKLTWGSSAPAGGPDSPGTNARRHAVQRRRVGRSGRPQRHRRSQPRKLFRRRQLRSHEEHRASRRAQFYRLACAR